MAGRRRDRHAPHPSAMPGAMARGSFRSLAARSFGQPPQLRAMEPRGGVLRLEPSRELEQNQGLETAVLRDRHRGESTEARRFGGAQRPGLAQRGANQVQIITYSGRATSRSLDHGAAH